MWTDFGRALSHVQRLSWVSCVWHSCFQRNYESQTCEFPVLAEEHIHVSALVVSFRNKRAVQERNNYMD